IQDLREYEREREEFRRRIIEMKKRRRVQLGDLLTITFESTDTMRFQVQEMARIERMLTDEQIRQEVETYNQLIPEASELSGTLFLEIDDKQRLYEWLPSSWASSGRCRSGCTTGRRCRAFRRTRSVSPARKQRRPWTISSSFHSRADRRLRVQSGAHRRRPS